MSQHLHDKISKLEAEIQQLKQELSGQKEMAELFAKVIPKYRELEKQIDTAKTILHSVENPWYYSSTNYYAVVITKALEVLGGTKDA